MIARCSLTILFSLQSAPNFFVQSIGTHFVLWSELNGRVAVSADPWEYNAVVLVVRSYGEYEKLLRANFRNFIYWCVPSDADPLLGNRLKRQKKRMVEDLVSIDTAFDAWKSLFAEIVKKIASKFGSINIHSCVAFPKERGGLVNAFKRIRLATNFIRSILSVGNIASTSPRWTFEPVAVQTRHPSAGTNLHDETRARFLAKIFISRS
jgi:hypothetical protein